MSIQGTPTSGIRWLIDANGRIVGYRNPVTDQDAEVAAGDSYLGPQTMAQLQASAYADGTPGLLALAKDTVVYLTDRCQAVTPSPDGTTWTTGASGDRYTPAELAALATPLLAGTLVADADGVIYGQSDGAGGYSALGGSTVSSEYHTHFFAPLATGTDRKAWDISGALSDGVFQTDLSAATAWATAGFLTQPNPTVAGQQSMVVFPAISWDWSAGDSLFLFWVGRMTPEGAEMPWAGDTSGSAAGNGIKLTCTGTDTTAGKFKVNVYQNSPAVSVFGPTSTNVVFEEGVTHSLAVCIRPHVSGSGGGMAYWTDGARNAGHAAGFLMPANGPVSTVNAATFKLGGDGTGSPQLGIALQTRALVVLKGRRGTPPSIADMDALVAALHRNSQALVTSEAW